VFSNSKPFEYNYVIGQNDDDEIVEFAGKFQAAHSGGENSIAFGVLFLLGVGEPLTDRMIDKWRWLRDVLIFDGSLRPDVDQRPHKLMPRAATACAGPSVDARWPEFLLPWKPAKPTPITPTPTDGDDDMLNATSLWRPKGYANIFAVTPDGARHLGGETFNDLTRRLNAAGQSSAVIVSAHPQELKSVLALAGVTNADLIKS